MQNGDTGQVHTAHTTNLVPLVYIGRPAEMAEHGSLSDIAPSMLHLMNMEVPPEMTGTPLVEVLPAGGEVTAPAEDVGLHG
jgi:2,3-bisphosphoglycerate-independent phosphoglycerate mutase